MPRFAVRIIAFVALAAMIAWSLSAVSSRLSHPYKLSHFRVQQLLQKSEQVSMLSVGNSVSRGIEFDLIGGRGYHMWIPGSDVFETKFLVEALAPRLPNLEVVLFAVPYFTFSYDNTIASDGSRVEIRREHYSVLPVWRWIDGDVKDFVGGKSATIARRDHWKPVVQALLRGGSGRPDQNQFWRAMGDGNLMRLAQVKSGDYYPDRDSLEGEIVHEFLPPHLESLRAVDEANPLLAEKVLTAIEDLGRYLSERGIRFICYTPPFYHTFNENYDRDAIDRARRLMDEAVSGNGVEYYDFSHDSTMTLDHTLFLDGHHLNRAGGRQFTMKLGRSAGLLDDTQTAAVHAAISRTSSTVR